MTNRQPLDSRAHAGDGDGARRELSATVADMKTTATLFVQRHAAIYAPDVSAEMVTAICRALGDISIDEATAALDRLQAERAHT